VRKGWTLRDLERETGIVPSHLSRIERGLSAPTERVALAMDAAFPHRHGWFSDFMNDYAEWAPPGYLSLGPYENAATRLWAWCPGVLHGLVQTEAYARALLSTSPNSTPEKLAQRVQARMERQKRVLQRKSPPVACFLVDALALLREVGSPEIMADALDHLLAVAALPDITMQVVPAVGHPANASGILLADDVAYAEHAAQGFTYTDDGAVTELGRLVTTIQGESYRVSESIQMIGRMRDTWKRGVNPVTAMLTGETASR
jgi:transcriptional regulator with XRE-family HTH domain